MTKEKENKMSLWPPTNREIIKEVYRGRGIDGVINYLEKYKYFELIDEGYHRGYKDGLLQKNERKRHFYSFLSS